MFTSNAKNFDANLSHPPKSKITIENQNAAKKGFRHPWVLLYRFGLIRFLLNRILLVSDWIRLVYRSVFDWIRLIEHQSNLIECQSNDNLIKVDQTSFEIDMALIEAYRRQIKAERASIEADRKSIEADRRSIEGYRRSIKSDQISIEVDQMLIRSRSKTIESTFFSTSIVLFEYCNSSKTVPK